MKYLLTAMCVAWNMHGLAQTRCVVVDMETKTPLRDVVVTVSNITVSRITTDYKGEFVMPEDADSIIIGHTGYETRHMVRDEITDTISMMRKYMAIREVIVYGKKPEIGFNLKSSLDKAVVGVPKPGGVSFDFFSIFTWKKKKRTKERIKAIENY